jgi:uncharacterized Fe-S cluster protein YjdI
VTVDTPGEEDRLGKAYTAPSITVFYDRARCRHYAECVRGLPQVFDVTRRPWIRADLADADTVAEVVRRCPTGALHYRLAAGDPEAPTRPTTITRDPRGPLLVRGDLVLDTPDGALHETRAALCGCGRSESEPFCDGACGVNDHRPPAPGIRRTHPTRSLEPGQSRMPSNGAEAANAEVGLLPRGSPYSHLPCTAICRAARTTSAPRRRADARPCRRGPDRRRRTPARLDHGQHQRHGPRAAPGR